MTLSWRSTEAATIFFNPFMREDMVEEAIEGASIRRDLPSRVPKPVIRQFPTPCMFLCLPVPVEAPARGSHAATVGALVVGHQGPIIRRAYAGEGPPFESMAGLVKAQATTILCIRRGNAPQ